MKTYIGTKLLKAKPMTLGEYNKYRGWDIPEDEDLAAPGCLVEYLDGGEPNHADHAGYISWSPGDVFEKAYRAMVGMTFGLAIEALKSGQKVARKGWNGKGMWLALIHPGNATFTKGGVSLDMQECIGMKTASPLGHMQPGWLASQADILAEDWEIVE